MAHAPLILDLTLAWERMTREVPRRAFVKCVHEFELIKLNTKSWLAITDARLQSGGYVFSNMEICSVPKGKHLIRPGSILTTEDTLIYYALLGSSFKKIYERIGWSQDIVDYSYRLNGANHPSVWILDRFKGWENFRIKSVAKLKKYSHVVVADIAAFYENIDLSRLISEVKSLNVPSAEVELLSKALNRWASTSGRGLPQGCIPSDILAKLYMDSIDKALKNKGYDHYRYVDDIRIFCNSEQEAKQAIIDLAILLREKGLSLQSSKTQICNREEAVKEIEEVQPIIMGLIKKLKKDPLELLLTDSSDEIHMLEDLGEADINTVHIKIIKEAFESFFVKAQYKFDKTLFRFLLRRLYKEQDDYAVAYCASSLLVHPEETEVILKYFTEVNEATSLKIVENFICSVDALYEFQNYQLIEWLNNQKMVSSPQLLARVRHMAFSASSPYYLRSVAMNFMGKHGDSSDLDQLEQLCKSSNGLEQTKLMCTLERLEKSRRNGLFKRIEDAAFHNKSAIVYVANSENQAIKAKTRK